MRAVPRRTRCICSMAAMWNSSPESGRRMKLQALRCGEEAATDLKTYLATATAQTPVQALRLPREALTELGMASRAMLGLTSHLSGEALLPAPKPAAAPAAAPVPRKQVVGWLAVLLVPPLLYFAGGSAGLTQEAALFVGILAATVLMWLLGLADKYIPPLLAIAAVLMVGLVPSDIALGGFASRTLTTLIGVYALASLIGASGLSYRIMTWLLIRLPDTPFWQQTALLLSGYALSPIMPSGNARLSLLQPLYRDMVSGLSLKPRSPASVALMAAMFSGAMLFSPMMLTSIPCSRCCRRRCRSSSRACSGSSPRWWLGHFALAARDGRTRHADEPHMAARRGQRSTGRASSDHRQALPRRAARVGAACPRGDAAIDLRRGSSSRPQQLPLNAGGSRPPAPARQRS
jgi:hypothetical protein